MTEQRNWPQRYRVRIRLSSGGSADHPVVTWLGEAKAIALAVAAHTRADPSGTPPYDVEVDDLGPAGRTADGTVALESRDLIDRMEF